MTFDNLLSESGILDETGEEQPKQGRLIGHDNELKLLLEIFRNDAFATHQ